MLMLVMDNILNGTSNVKKKKRRNPIPVKTGGRKKKTT